MYFAIWKPSTSAAAIASHVLHTTPWRLMNGYVARSSSSTTSGITKFVFVFEFRSSGRANVSEQNSAERCTARRLAPPSGVPISALAMSLSPVATTVPAPSLPAGRRWPWRAFCPELNGSGILATFPVDVTGYGQVIWVIEVIR